MIGPGPGIEGHVPGDNVSLVTASCPGACELREAQRNGRDRGMRGGEELGRSWFQDFYTTPAGETSTLRLVTRPRRCLERKLLGRGLPSHGAAAGHDRADADRDRRAASGRHRCRLDERDDAHRRRRGSGAAHVAVGAARARRSLPRTGAPSLVEERRTAGRLNDGSGHTKAPGWGVPGAIGVRFAVTTCWRRDAARRRARRAPQQRARPPRSRPSKRLHR